MNNKYYTDLIENYIPSTDPRVPIDQPFIDDRGIIQNLLQCDLEHVAIITSKKGSIRSNHFHKSLSHFLYIIEGEMEYYSRDINADNNVAPIIVKKGEMVYTAPLKVHKTVFTQDSIILSMVKKDKNKTYDEDSVKMEF